MDKYSRKTTNIEIKELADVMIQMGLIDLYRTSHPKKRPPHGMFSKVDHNSVKKQISTDTPQKFNKPLYHIRSQWLKSRIPINSWKLKNTQVNHSWVKEEVKKLKTS